MSFLNKFSRVRPWLKRLLAAVFIIFVVMVSLVVVLGIRISDRVSSKSSAANSDRRPEETISSLLPEWQTEPHTCGMHSLAAVYAAYGLPPEAENLRYRLGVDVPASPTDRSTIGTLHPDMLRVLAQDGFGWQLLDLESRMTDQKLLEHLEQGQAALALIARRENGNLHWVAVSRDTSNATEGALSQVRVIDSLFMEPYNEL